MSTGGGHVHRHGAFHQTNKPFKGASKRRARVKGRTEAGDDGESVSAKPTASHKRHAGVKGANAHQSAAARSRDDRRNKAKQLIKHRRAVLRAERREGTADGAPKLICVLPLGEQSGVQKLLDALYEDSERPTNPLSFVHARQRTRFGIAVPPPNDLFSMLDAAKVADLVLLCVDVREGVSESGRAMCQAMLLQGCSTVIACITGLGDLPVGKATKMRGALVTEIERLVGADTKVVSLGRPSDASMIWRTLATTPARGVHWREQRAYVVAQRAEFDASSVDSELRTATLIVHGYVRGAHLSAHQLVHLPGVGDFNIEAIAKVPDPAPMRGHAAAPAAAGSATASSAPEILSAVPAEQRDVPVEESGSGPLPEPVWRADRAEAARRAGASGGEDDDEDVGDDAMFYGDVRMKRVPKGTSSYQAEWLDGDEVSFPAGPDADEHGGAVADDDDDDDDDDDGSEDTSSLGSGVEFHDDYADSDSEAAGAAGPSGAAGDADAMSDGSGGETIDNMTMSEAPSVADADALKQRERERLRKAQNDDVMWPDEVDTPQHIPARIRFKKYRGLASFRTSPWPADVALPSEYGRIFQFKDFRAAARRAVDECREYPVRDGTYVAIRVLGVPFNPQLLTLQPLTLWALLRHETKLSLVHYAVMPHTTPDDGDAAPEPVRSKTPLLFQCGFRRFHGQPVFSQNNIHCDKHKAELFLQPGRFSLASLYAQVSYPHTPTLLFHPTSFRLIAKGQVHSVDPRRVVLKKIILTGFPYKVHKRHAVVRYMFWHPDDVRWFKPVEVWTKMGARGHILEPRGTKGYMKVMFDKQIKGSDTVCLSLYKRVFPRWRSEAALLPFVHEWRAAVQNALAERRRRLDAQRMPPPASLPHP